MKTLEDIILHESDRQAVRRATDSLRQRFPISRIVLFGSKARGDDDGESDVDLLVLTARPLDALEKDAVMDAIYQTQLDFGVVLSPMVVDQAQWNGPLWSLLPVKAEIEREGVLL